MSIAKKIGILVATVLAGSFAQADSNAGLFVEPMVTYESGSTTVDYPSPFSNSTGSVNGFGLGARLGFHISEALFIAADARYSRPQFKDSSNNLDSQATSYNLGPVLGLQMPGAGIRLWGAYVMDGQLDPEESNNVDVKFTKPKGYRVGVGFHVSSVSLNLEYQDIKYDSTTLEKVGPFTGSASDNISLQDKAYIASVSFPIEL